MRKFKRVLALLLVLSMVLSCFTGFASAEEEAESIAEQANGSSAKDKGALSEEFEKANSYRYADDEIVRAIVVLKTAPEADAAGSPEKKAAHRIALLSEHQRVLRAMGSIPYEMGYEFTALLNGFSCDVPYGDLESIAEIDGVDAVYIANSYAPPIPEEPQSESSGQMMGNYISNQSGYNGEGVVVAVLDTGLRTTHEAFQVYPGMPITETVTEADITKAAVPGKYISAKIPFAYDYADDDNDVSDLNDHGTHVSGIAVGYAEAEDGAILLSGAAPAAQLLFMKVSAGERAYTDVYFYALEDAYRLGADVISMSFGTRNGFTYDSSLETDVFGHIFKRLEAAGIVVCAAAANEESMNYYSSVGYTGPDYADYGTLCSPSTYEGNISVASVENAMSYSPESKSYVNNSDGWKMNDFSSWGTTPMLTIDPTITGVGGSVYSAVNRSDSSYEVKSGTSMATPNVAGTFACVLQALAADGNSLAMDKPTRAARAKALLESTGIILTDADGYIYSVRKQGAGLANSANAIATYTNAAYIVNPIQELGDDKAKTGVYTMELNLVNEGSDAVTYDNFGTYILCDNLEEYSNGTVYNTLTSDYIYFDDQGDATVCYTVDGKEVTSITLNKGEELTVTVTITLNDEIKAYLDSYFTNGACIEGYVSFSQTAAEKEGTVPTCDINADTYETHATFLTFYGDWTQGPAMESVDSFDYLTARYLFNTYNTDNGKPHTQLGYTVDNVMYNLYGAWYTVINYAYATNQEGETSGYLGANRLDLDTTEFMPEHISFSTPKSDGSKYYAGGMRLEPSLIRHARHVVMTIANAKTGEIYRIEDDEYVSKRSTLLSAWLGCGSFSWDGTNSNGAYVPSGTVATVTFDIQLPYGESEDLWQENVWSFNVTVDSTAPVMESAIYDEATETLTVTARDEQYLAGIYLISKDYSEDYSNAYMKETFSSDVKNQSFTATFDVSGLDVQNIAVVAMDYATNETYTTEIRVQEKEPDYRGTCGGKLTWEFYKDSGLLRISGTGPMTDWMNESSVPWVNDRHHIQTVKIGSGVTSIGDYAFARCSSLTKVIIPDSVTSIGDHAFECSYVTEVAIPNSVTSIGDYAFANCNDLSDVTIGNGVVSIGEGAFFESYRLTKVTIPDSVKTIGSFAFMFCGGLTSVTIGKGVTSIGLNAFEYCYNLSKMNYTGTEKMWEKMEIEDGNDALLHAEIYYGSYYSGTCGNNLTWELWTDTGLLRISGTGPMTDWPDLGRAPWYPYQSEIRAVEIGTGVTSIGDSAFYLYSSLESVTIGNSVTSIGDYAFYSCSKITDMDIPNSVISIGDYAFSSCSSLPSVTIGSNMTYIGICAFRNCFSLTNVHYKGTEEMWNKITIMGCNHPLLDAKINYMGVVQPGVAPAHSVVIDPAVEATCTTDGLTEGAHCSVCGMVLVEQETIPATGHSYSSQVTTAATCTNAGVKTFTCSKCNHSYTEAIAATGHTEVVDKAVAATCTTAGKTEGSHCSVCNAVIKAQTTVPATGHSYTYKATKNPTTSATGTLTGTCSKCSGTTTVTLPKLNTTDYTKTVTKAATCTATGTDTYKWKTTTYGSFSFTATTAALGHSYTTKVTAPTCTARGYTTHTCTRCANSYKDSYTGAIGHNYIYVVGMKPTTSVIGRLDGTCSNCSGITAVILPALNTADYTKAVTKAPTCTETGIVTYVWNTTTYGTFSFTATTPALGHSYTDQVTAPTCTAQGYTTHTCSRCSDSYKDTYTNATGHSYTSKVTTAATCTNAGVKTYTCSTCSHSYTEAISATGHTAVTDKAVAATCTTAGKTEGSHCSVCNAVIKAQTTIPATGHSYTSKVTTAATCTKDGVKTFTCSKCNHSYTEAIAATGHTPVTDKAVAATCTTAGKTEGSHCSVCNAVIKAQTTIPATGHSYTSKVTTAATCTKDGVKTFTCSKCSHSCTEAIAATGHTEVVDKAVAATCTAAGKTEGSHCSVCNAVIKAQTTIPAAGHSYTSKATTAATCTKAGVKTFTCSKCNHSYTEAIAATGHTPVTDKAVAATCTTAGKTEGSHCSVCNAVIKAQETVPATGHSYSSKVTTAATCTKAGVKTFTCSKCNHSYTEAIAATGHTPVTDKAVAATCTTAGKTEGSHCSVCNAVIKAQETVPDLGHDYTGVITAPTCTEQGYTAHTCSRCSDSYKDSYTDATGHSYRYTDKGETHEAVCAQCSHSMTEAHSYTDNTCVCGAVEVLAPITDSSIIINHSLNLASDISINYAVKASLLSDYDSFYLEVQVPIYRENALTGFKALTIEPVLKGSYYYFTMTDLTAVNMSDILVATLHMNKGKQEYLSKPDNYSVATYAMVTLNQSNAAHNLKVLCADLLRYGAAAQVYKNYRTDTLATANMTDAHKTYFSDLGAVTFGNTNNVYNDLSNPMITWAGKTMNLGSKVVVKFVFNAGAYTGDISKLTLRMIYQGSSGAYHTVTLSNPTVYNEARRMYAFDFDGLMAAELRTAISVAVYNGDTQLSQTMQYSADTYGNSTSGTLLELCKALFAYSDSAKAFFAK